MSQDQLLAGRYRLVKPLGEGGMGTVVEVEDTWEPGLHVALKTIFGSGAVGEAQALRLKEEFRALARLRHPNLVGVHDYGRLDEGRSYLAMELVEGPGLEALVAEGPMPLAQAAPLLSSLLQALDFIHSRGYVHRDVKPANLKLDAQGELKLLDFGLLIPVGASGGGDAGLSGSVAYMAPEAIAQAPVGPAADLYAVGCVAFELLTGRPPFVGSPLEILRAHLTTAPPALGDARPGLTARLEAWVAALLAKEPDKRPLSAEAARAWLAGIAGAKGLTAAQRASYVEPAQLMGREAEMAELQGLLQQAQVGQGGALLVLAPAGAGKSRLTRELVLRAKLADLPVHVAQASVEAAPLAPLAAALKPLAADAQALAKEPALAARLWPDQAPPGAEPTEDLSELLQALGRWLPEASGAQARLFLLEDAHLADAATVAAWNHLTALAPTQPWALVATARSEALAPGARLLEPVADGQVKALRPGPLGPDQVEAWVRAALSPVAISPEVLARLHDATGGNAYHLSALLRHLVERGDVAVADGTWRFPEDPAALRLPEGLRATLHARLEGLSPEARSLAEALAVLGGQADLALAMAIAFLDEESALDAAEQLVDRQLLTRHPQGLAFPHATLREALEEALAPPLRAAMHQAAGEALEARAEAGQPSEVMALAHHFRLGLDSWKAYTYLREAGEVAEGSGAEVLALTLWEDALEALGRCEPSKEVQQAENQLRWALGMAAFIFAPAVAVRALAPWVGSLRSKLPTKPGRPNQMDGHSFLGIALGFAGQVAEAFTANDKALALGPGPGTPAHGALLVARTPALLAAGRIDEAVALGQEAEALLWGDLGLKPQPSWLAARVGCLAVQLWVSFQGHRPSEALVQRALAAARAIGDEAPFTVMENLGLHAVLAGRLDEVGAYLEATAAKCRRLGAPPYPTALVVRVMALRLRGAHEEACAAAAWALAQPQVATRAVAAGWLAVVAAQLRLDAGEGMAAWSDLALAYEEAEERGWGLVAQRAELALAEAALLLNRLGDAAFHSAHVEAVAASGPCRNPLNAASAARLAGIAARAEGRLDEAFAAFDRAGQHLALLGADAPLEAALLARARGTAFVERGRRSEALEAFAIAEAGFASLGLARLQHEAAAEAARTKAQLSPKRQLGPGMLKPPQRDA